MPYSIQVEQQKRCCGIYLIHTFEKNPDPKKLSDYTEHYKKYYGVNQAFLDRWNSNEKAETIDEYKTRVEKKLKALIKEYWLKKSYFLVHLDKLENDNLEQIFLDLGFEVLVPMTKNPTGTSIITYIYHLLPKENPKEVKSILKKRKISPKGL